jgi:TPR repeat protein
MDIQANEMGITNLCPSCFSEKGQSETCPFCGYRPGDSNDDWNRLKPGTMIHGRYIAGGVLGQGGFGITYLGLDSLLGLKLAIKEYYPAGVAVRNTANRTVMTASSEPREDFKRGMEKFLEEARILARFEGQPNIVSVRDFFEENGTAYMVMTYLEGRTLQKYLEEQGGRLSFRDAMDTLSPVMDALDEVHASGLIHRDISPDNIFVTRNGQVKLLDFGASKSAINLAQQRSHSVVLKRGYSPPEQYQSRGSLGPWTDVYGMAATLYRCVTGMMPPDALDRLGEDTLVQSGEIGRLFPSHAQDALMSGLSLAPKDRPQSMRAFRERLLGEENSAPSMAEEPAAPAVGEGTVSSEAAKKSENQEGRSVFPQVAAALIAFVFFFLFLSNSPSRRPVDPPPPSTTPAAERQRDDPWSLFELGVKYEKGNGVPQDYGKAVEYYRRAAEQGHEEARVHLGFLYYNGRGVSQDYGEAAKWFRMAAEQGKQGNAKAQFTLGHMYDYGYGVLPNNSEAVSWYRKAAEQGYAEAQFFLGSKYAKGEDVPRNDLEAAKWYRKAAAQGHGPAKEALREMNKAENTPLELIIPKTVRATVSASQVLLRSSPSIHSEKEGMLERGEALIVVAKWVAEVDNEGILNNDISTNSGYVLKKGRAVTIRKYDAYGERYEVTVQDSRGDVSGWVHVSTVKSLKGVPWYKVVKTDGQTGWVLGEFLSLESRFVDTTEKIDFEGIVRSFLPFMRKYAEAVVEAVNSGSLSPVLSFLNPEGPLLKAKVEKIKELHNAGIRQKLLGIEITQATLEGGEIVLFVNEEFEFLYPDGRRKASVDSSRYRIRRAVGDSETSLRLLYSSAMFSPN